MLITGRSMGRMQGYCLELHSHSSNPFRNYHLWSHRWQMTSPHAHPLFSPEIKLLSLSPKRLDRWQWVTSSTGLSFVTDTSFQNGKTRNQSGCCDSPGSLSCLRRAAVLHICALSTWDSMCQSDWALVREDIWFMCETASKCFSPLPSPPSLFFSIFMCACDVHMCTHICVCGHIYVCARGVYTHLETWMSGIILHYSCI